MSERPQILGGGDQEVGIVAHVANGDIAGATQETSHRIGRMVVIDGQFLESTISDSSLELFADCADAILPFQHLHVLLDGYPVVLLQMILPKVANSRVGNSPLSYRAVLLGFAIPFFWRAVGAFKFVGFVSARLATPVLRHAHLRLYMTARADRRLDLGDRQALFIAFALVLAIGCALFGGSIRPLFATGSAPAFSAKAALECAYDVFVVTVFAKILFHVCNLSHDLTYDKSLAMVAKARVS